MVGVIIATIAFFFHIYGFCLYALLIGSHELFAIIKQGLQTQVARRFALFRILSLAMALSVPAILLFVSLPLGVIDSPPFLATHKAKSLEPQSSNHNLLDAIDF